jgi:ABC-type nickel/cobalt efflux system permease component RcnA
VRIGPELLLVGAVIAVGVLHTLVPDHWLPIAVVARNSHWTRGQTARAASIAGLGHTLSTLAIGVVVWLAGVAVATRYGNLMSLFASIALIAFGLWIAVASLRELRAGHHHHEGAEKPGAVEANRRSLRTTLLLILGSSPMVEGIPAFFAAGRYGAGLLAVMAACFAVSTIVTYVVLCVYSHAALETVRLGPLERYGEVISGAVITIVGIVFLLWPVA